ncbi:MAG: hypothetical protein AAF915_10225 [Cyanobacteria bacterium P01_D01_bin.50]
MTTLDSFKLEINPSFKTYWTQDKGLCVTEIYINDKPLIELVHQAEEPFVKAEIKERRAEGDDIDEISFPPGDYMYLPPRANASKIKLGATPAAPARAKYTKN